MSVKSTVAVLAGAAVIGSGAIITWSLTDEQGHSLCVDARGENSTEIEIAEAVLNVPVPNGDGGQNVAEQMQTGLDEMGITGLSLRPEDIAENIYADVPAGGDAKFAEAACGLTEGWERAGLNTAVDDVRRTPHLLRSVGRAYCDDAKSIGSAEAADADDGKQREEILDDPQRYLDQTIDAIDRSIAGIDSDQGDPAVISRVIDDAQVARAKAVELKSNPQQLLDSVSAQAKLFWAAIEFDCPNLSVAGFSDGCDDYRVPTGGTTDGVLTYDERWGKAAIAVFGIKGPMSCVEATSLMDSHYRAIYGQGEIADPPDFDCLQGDLTPFEKPYFIVQCYDSGAHSGNVISLVLAGTRGDD